MKEDGLLTSAEAQRLRASPYWVLPVQRWAVDSLEEEDARVELAPEGRGKSAVGAYRIPVAAYNYQEDTFAGVWELRKLRRVCQHTDQSEAPAFHLKIQEPRRAAGHYDCRGEETLE